jgi:hypothetical protein
MPNPAREADGLSTKHCFEFLPVLGTVGIGILPFPARLGYLPNQKVLSRPLLSALLSAKGNNVL